MSVESRVDPVSQRAVSLQVTEAINLVLVGYRYFVPDTQSSFLQWSITTVCLILNQIMLLGVSRGT